MEKALREAKRNTSWVDPDAGWEDGVQALLPRRSTTHQPFLDDFEPFAGDRGRARASGPRSASSLLKLTAPGVPDIYQGDELPYRALVDPDNRRPVDWERRRSAAGADRGRRAPTGRPASCG